MIGPAVPSSLAAFCAAILAAAMLARQRSSFASWTFFFGMLLLAVEAAAHGFALRGSSERSVMAWESAAFMAAAAHSLFWIGFSLVFSRGNHRRFLRAWRWILVVFAILPLVFFLLPGGLLREIAFQQDHPSAWLVDLAAPGKWLNALLLVEAVIILAHLETTFRSAVGTMQWKIKFVVLAFGIVFGSRVYTRSQALLFTGYDGTLPQVEAFALVLACVLIVLAYLRSGLAEIDVYPSQAVLNGSVTIFLAGAYLFVVGVLAQLAARLGGVGGFQFQVLVVVVAMAVLGLLALSDRLRQKIRLLVSRHFQRPRYDSREVWKLVTQRTSRLVEHAALCQEVARLVSETFQILSVTVWTVDRHSDRLRLAGSTHPAVSADSEMPGASGCMRSACLAGSGPFDFESLEEDWAQALRAATPPQFPHGGNRWCIPLVTGDQWLGVLVLEDRVNGMPYSGEELDLLACIGEQVAAALLKLQLTGELVHARELEAFQTMSTFLVHDLKNTASTLSLMLKNLPIHFDKPEFREDAIRGIANTVNRVNDLVRRLGAVREKLELRPTRWDLNELIMEALGELGTEAGLEIEKKLQPLPAILADREHIRSVATNLLLNSRDALAKGGRILVETSRVDGFAVLTVTDNGSGMTREFMRDSLFRPFQTTKKKGLGIGMFQSRMIVEAHQGRIQVQSEAGVGTTFRISLPLAPSEEGKAAR